MAIQVKDFRVKNGLYVGTNVDALRGDLSARNIYGKLLALSAYGENGTGSDTALSGQQTLNYEAVSGVNVTISDSNIRFGLNVDTDDFNFDGGVLKLASTGTGQFGTVEVGGGYGDTGITFSNTGNISANGELVLDGNASVGGTLDVTGATTLSNNLSVTGAISGASSLTIDGNTTLNGTLDATGLATFAGGLSASTLSGDGNALTTNFTISAGGDVDGVSSNITALNGTYSLNLELTDVLSTSAGAYGSQTSIPTFVVDTDGRVTSAAEVTIATTLSTAGDSTTGDVNLLTEVLSVVGTSNEIETSVSNSTITIGLPDNVTVTGDLTVNGNDINDSSGNSAITFDGSRNTTAQGNLTVVGDLTVNGNTTTQNVSTVLVEDPVIKLANGNSADSLDIGFYGEYVSGTSKYAGLIRDVTFAGGNKPFVFFDGTDTDILSANASGSGKPGLSNFADVYMGRIGINTTDYAAGNRLTVSGVISSDDVAHFAGGYGNSGVTIQASGNIVTDGGLIVETNSYLGGTTGYTSTGVTITNTGNISAAGNFVLDGTSTLTGEVQIGGGYGDTGITLTDTGNISADGSLTVGSFYADELFIGGGYGDTGVTITSTGAISADGGVFADAFYSKTGGSAIDFNDNIDLDGTFTSTGAISGRGALTIDGNVTLTDAASGSVTINATTINLANIAAGTDDTVVVWNGSSLVTDEIDSRVWGATLVDNNGASGTANRLTKWTDGDSVVDSRISDDTTDIVIGVGGNEPVTFTASSSATSVTYNDTTGYHSLSTLVEATCTNLPIFSKPATEFRSGKIVVQSVLGSTQYEVAELLLIHDGTDVHVTEYGNISTAATFCTDYSADINGGNVRILATNNHATVDSVITAAVQQFLI